MSVDFSFLKNPENLLFLFIILLAGLIVFFIIFLVIVKVLKLLKRLFVPPSNAKEKSEKVKSSLAPTAKENINMPKQRVMGGDFTRNINSKKDDLDVKKQDIVKIEREKEMASATQGLEKLKTSHSSGEDSSKSSGLPKINNNPEKEDDYKKIKIPRRKRFKSATMVDETF